MNMELRDGEKIVKEGPANLQRGIEAVGGKLFLTTQRLVFTSHKFNVQTGSTNIEVKNIQSCQPRWTKFLGVIPLIPNSLAVLATDGKEYCFVLYGREKWAAEIEAQKNA
ncbi:hypothetical protein HR45_13180 [Shewanella mangrovi]|uniref:GRAM domain-containing protein n=2 Tax=Shewanella mangrovi TaxID=1515746 RepID=A0A094JCM8_9GAMM|nr:GRAM domain-containing protein [Shewanella mangrovi]KFZ36992.1 hypothetical protein HR45_13180 [Shewanella mangrovi]